MGMDVMHFEVKRIIPQSEIKITMNEAGWIDVPEKLKVIEVNERTLTWMEKKSFSKDDIQVIKEFDWEAWGKNNPEYESHEFYDYHVYGEDEHWIQLVTPENETILLTNGFIFKEVKYLLVEAKEIGYMRKPFRHTDTPSYQEEDAIILTVTNFSDNGLDGYSELEKIDSNQTKESNVFIFDVKQLQTLKNHTCDESVFIHNFIENWKDKSYVQFNW